MQTRIRKGVRADAGHFAGLAQATFLESYAGIIDGGDILLHRRLVQTEAAYEADLANAEIDLFLAVLDPGEAPVGFAMLSPPDLPVELSPDDLELKRIYVLHRFHGTGLAQRLMAAVLEAATARGAKRVLLGAYGENHRAIAFYRRHGFEQVGTRLFRVGETDYDDVVLAKVL